jgi:hypothetical protein
MASLALLFLQPMNQNRITLLDCTMRIELLLMDVSALQPTAQSPNARLKMQLDVLHLHSSDTPAPAPTAAAQSDLLMLHYCTLLHPMGSYFHVPTAAHLAALLQQL